MNSKICREKAGEIKTLMGKIVEKAKEEKRSLSPEERNSFDGYDREHDALLAQAEGFERIEKFDTLDSRSAFKTEVATPTKPFSSMEERNKAYHGWFYHGTPKAKAENWRCAERHGIEVNNPHMHFEWLPWETRQQVVGSGPALVNNSNSTAGGDLTAVDNQLMREIDVALKFYGNVLELATVITTPTGAPLPWPTSDDTSNLAVVNAEDSSITEVDVTFGQKVLSAYKYDALVRVSWELQNDSVIDLASFIGERFGERIGRAVNQDIIRTGAGSGSGITPITSVATLGATSASSSAINYSDLNNFEYSVDRAYRERPKTAFMFHDTTMKQLSALVDGNGRPLLMSSLQGISVALPDSLKGYRYVVNNGVAAFATSGTPIVAFFGDWSKLIVRRVAGSDGGFNLIRLNERYAELGLVGYIGWTRLDALLSDAGQHPIKYLQMHS